MGSQIISSTLIAINLQRNFEEITKAKNYLIFIVDEAVKLSVICEINQYLEEKKLGKILPISFEEDNSAFSIVFENSEDLDNLLKTIKRMLWICSRLLSTKIVLMAPKIRILKDYGEGE